MGDKWMDERDREMRERDWRRSEQYGRGDEDRGPEDEGRRLEPRSFDSDDDSRYGAQRGGSDRDRVFGERETGANYTRGSGLTSGGGAYGTGGAYGGGESYGRGSSAGRPSGYQSTNQNTPYRGPAPRFGSQDYTQGGRFYGDDRREPIYREEYGQGGVEYGDVPRGYDTRSEGGRGYSGRGGQGGYDSGYQGRMGPARGGSASGGSGGYDYERGYGDAGRGAMGRDRERWDDRGRFERGRDERGRDEGRGRDPGDLFQRAGERISSWFKGDHLMQGSRPEERNEDRRGYREDLDRDRRPMSADRGHRGRGPKNYQRPDERINEEAHERLTDDSWLDAINITVSVSGGEVTLSGTVESREAKHRAERLVEDISGVSHVQNNLRVDRGGGLTSPGSGYGDSVMEAQMRKDDPTGTSTAGTGAGQSTAGKKT
jgi:hypothetical protein